MRLDVPHARLVTFLAPHVNDTSHTYLGVQTAAT